MLKFSQEGPKRLFPPAVLEPVIGDLRVEVDDALDAVIMSVDEVNIMQDIG